MAETSGEKSFLPTAKKKREAARKGDVLRSRELATAAGVLVGAVWLEWAGPWLLDGLGTALRAGFSFDRTALDGFAPGRFLAMLLALALPPVLVLGIAVLAASLSSQLGFGEGRWVGTNLMPKGSRIDPLAVHLQEQNIQKARFRSRPFARSDEIRRNLPEIMVPLKAVWGGDDQTAWPSVEARYDVLREFHPELVTRTVPDAGHWVMYEQAEAYNAALVDVLGL